MSNKEKALVISRACRGALKELKTINFYINYPGETPIEDIIKIIEKHAAQHGINSSVLKLIILN